ncbi:hypothetical protein JZ751_025827, partial [Albula glossodonta]
MMKEVCRICARELLGNQRRWIFHPAAKLDLQALLSYAIGRQLIRDGRGEFACSKCAFMLSRMYRFDTVIARVEALSIDSLRRLLLEKDRLRQCISGLYRRSNSDEPGTGPGTGADYTVDMSALPEARYHALLQEDFAYSLYESWADQTTEHSSSLPLLQVSTHRDRRCRRCAALRVADSDYEAVCKVPRKAARSISCGPSTRYSASPPASRYSEALTAARAARTDSLPTSPGLSVESLDAGTEDRCWDSLSEERTGMTLLLNLVRECGYRPVHRPPGCRLPILCKTASPGISSRAALNNQPHRSPNARRVFRFPSWIQPGTHLDQLDLEQLWQDTHVEYLPIYFQQNLIEEQQTQLNQYECAAGQCVSELQKAQLQVQSLQAKIQESEDNNK